MPTPDPTTPTRTPIPLPPAAVAIAPPGDVVGRGYRMVVTTDRGRMSQQLAPELPVIESFPFLARHLRKAMAMGVRAHAVFHVEPIRPRR